MNKERTRGWLGQPSIIKSLEQKFGDRAMKERLSLTPDLLDSQQEGLRIQRIK